MCRQPTNTSARHAACHCVDQPASPLHDDDDDRSTILTPFIPKTAGSPPPSPSSPRGGDAAAVVVVTVPPQGDGKEGHGSEGSSLQEVRAILGIAMPMVLTGLLLYSRSMVSMLFLGRLGELPLAGGALAIGFANITGYSVLSGLAMGMEPICGQAFGVRQRKLLGLTLQRTVLLLLSASVPISFLWLNIYRILVTWCGQDEEIASAAGTFITWSWRSVWKDRNEDTTQYIMAASHADADLRHLGVKDTIERIKQVWTVGSRFYGIPESLIRACVASCPVCNGEDPTTDAAGRSKRRRRFEYTESFDVPARDVPARLQQLAAKHKVLCIRQKYIRFKPFTAEVKDYAYHHAGEPTSSSSAAGGKKSRVLKREPYASKRCGCGFRIRAIVPITNFNKKDKTFIYQEEGTSSDPILLLGGGGCQALAATQAHPSPSAPFPSLLPHGRGGRHHRWRVLPLIHIAKVGKAGRLCRAVLPPLLWGEGAAATVQERWSMKCHHQSLKAI